MKKNDNQASAVASSQEQAQAGTAENKLKVKAADGGQVAEASQFRSDKVKSEKNTNNSQSSLDFWCPLIMVILALLWELGLMRMVNQLQLTLMVQLLKTQQVILLN